jgi:signal transduction histidine kinase
MKIQHRITLIFVLFTVLIILVVNGIEYYFADQNAFEDFYKRLEIRAIVAAKIRFEQGDMAKSAYEEVRQEYLERLPYEKDYILPIDSLEQSKQAAGLMLPSSFYTEALQRGSARYRDANNLHLGYLYSVGDKKYLVVISAVNQFINTYLHNLRTIIIFSVISSAILSAVIGLWFSKLILKPVRTITQRMQEISVTQLHLRLDAGTGRDEISELSDTFNNMLDRLETAFETQKNFISNASHELNTPLTTIIGESEFALSKKRTQTEYEKSLAVILYEAERLRTITSSLLQLAQTGFNGKNQEFSQLRADEIIYTVLRTVENILPESNVQINAALMPEDQSKLVIAGNAQLLEIAFVNMVLNGCKYSMNQPVNITLAATHKKVIIIIEDQGIGIPDQEIAYIYEPFFRASNTTRFNGYGIGLPLARNIIRMHNGTLQVTSEENVGTRIRVTIPLYSFN